MLKITVELYPYGTEIGKETITEIIIGNTGKITDTQTTIDEYRNFKDIQEYKYNYKGWVKNFDKLKKFKGVVLHYRQHSVLVLLYKILEKEIQSYLI